MAALLKALLASLATSLFVRATALTWEARLRSLRSRPSPAPRAPAAWETPLAAVAAVAASFAFEAALASPGARNALFFAAAGAFICAARMPAHPATQTAAAAAAAPPPEPSGWSAAGAPPDGGAGRGGGGGRGGEALLRAVLAEHEALAAALAGLKMDTDACRWSLRRSLPPPLCVPDAPR